LKTHFQASFRHHSAYLTLLGIDTGNWQPFCLHPTDLTLPYWGFCHTKKLSHKRKINAVRQLFIFCMMENKCVTIDVPSFLGNRAE
ncbi:MAG: hypothetical protein VZR73_04955, partial [Acutalibacteraceae bacterium]|nr:hypothetical protein [Acutalibacteraceae bacterium]